MDVSLVVRCRAPMWRLRDGAEDPVRVGVAKGALGVESPSRGLEVVPAWVRGGQIRRCAEVALAPMRTAA